jgi:hypothetical protein
MLGDSILFETRENLKLDQIRTQYSEYKPELLPPDEPQCSKYVLNSL